MEKWTVQWAVEWAAHAMPVRGYFAMQMRLPTNSIYGTGGQVSLQLSGQPTTFKYRNIVKLSRQPTELSIIKLKM